MLLRKTKISSDVRNGTEKQRDGTADIKEREPQQRFHREETKEREGGYVEKETKGEEITKWND
jgi:hypothetical protein